MTELTFIDAWRKDDPRLMADAKAMWLANKFMPPDVAEERAQQLVSLVYAGYEVAGVTTAVLSHIEQLRGRFARLRGAVSPDHRRQRVCYQMAAHAVRVLEEWSVKNPDEKVVGVSAVMQSKELLWRLREPTWPEYDLNLNLVAYTPRDEQIRIAWFRHAEVEMSAA